MILGSHVSCAGGLSQAIQRAHELSCDCLQIFLSPPRAWPSEQKLIPFKSSSGGKKGSSRPAPKSLEEDVSPFRESLSESGLCFAVAHACYLINLASPDPKLWERSVAALNVEWHRAEQLQLDGLVLHPGSHTTTTPERGLDNVVRAIRRVQQDLQPEHCPLLLENTAGQGSCLGWNIQQLGLLIQELDSPTIGVCWDTCHAFAAGYDFRTAAGMKAMRNELEQFRLLDQIRVIHANDSFKECGSRVDRHEHIGLGCIGDAGWKRFVNALPFKELPMILETEKGTDENGVDWDARNLDKLRSYLK